MAKRRRLDPAPLETKAMDVSRAKHPGPRAGSAAPVARVAGEAAGNAALSEMVDFLEAARADGRLIVTLPLERIEAGHLVRDRLMAAEADEEMQALTASLRARGQQVPLDVVALEGGRYGLVSGLRRLTALKALARETGEARFAEAKVRVVTPNGLPEAYLSMVEENEIRAGLSFYERARVAVKAAETGAFADVEAALAGLFGNVSRAKRSKIRSFVTLVEALDGVLRFPAALSEKRGLTLVKALAADRDLAMRLVSALEKAAPGNAAVEAAVIETVAKGAAPPRKTPPPGKATEGASPERMVETFQTGAEDAAPMIEVESMRGQIVLRGPGVDADLVAALVHWIGARGYVPKIGSKKRRFRA